MYDRFQHLLYKAVTGLVRLFFPKMKWVGTDNLPDGPAVIVGNHAQIYGPIAVELEMEGNYEIWCAGEMMHWKEVQAYAFRDFWSGKPSSVRWIYKLLSYLIVPLSVLVFNLAHTIPVYHDSRVIHTFKQSVRRLQEGAKIVIFPEYDQFYDPVLSQFQINFVDVARLFFKKTGERLSFVPLYVAPKLKKLVLGKPVVFDPEVPLEQEKERITGILMERIVSMARGLPYHIVVPYRNVSKKEYPSNRVGKEDLCEETGR